jgi:hypothetical protein
MAEPCYSLIVRRTAERVATAWLREHGYCDCALQVRTVARRMLPIIQAYERAFAFDSAAEWLHGEPRLQATWEWHQQALTKGLHRAGASAAVEKKHYGHNDTAPHR